MTNKAVLGAPFTTEPLILESPLGTISAISARQGKEPPLWLSGPHVWPVTGLVPLPAPLCLSPQRAPGALVSRPLPGESMWSLSVVTPHLVPATQGLRKVLGPSRTQPPFYKA